MGNLPGPAEYLTLGRMSQAANSDDERLLHRYISDRFVVDIDTFKHWIHRSAW